MLNGNKTYKMLDFVGFNALVNWSVQYLGDSAIKFSRKYPLMRIGDFLTRNKTGIEIQDNETYKRATIRVCNGGIYLRDTQDGRHIGTKKQFLIKAGQFLLSKIDARNGAFGVVPDELDGGIITGNFWTFDVDYAIINPHYLTLLTTTKQFIDFCEQASNGTTNRHYLQEPLFLNIKVPVPSLEEQKELVNAYNEKINEAQNMENKANQIDKSIDDYLMLALGIATQREQKDQDGIYNYLRFHKLKDLSRWDLYNEKNKNYSEIYENVKLSKVILSKPQYGAGYSSKSYDGKIRYIRITDINEDGSLNDTSVSANGFAEQYLLRENDFLIARSGNTVGKTFLYKKKYGKAIYAGYLIRFELNTEKILPDYLLAYTKCSIYKNWIQGNMRVSAQPNINSQQYLDSIIVLPPMDIQKEIVSYVNEQKKIISRLKSDAKSIKSEAIKEFENIIF